MEVKEGRATGPSIEKGLQRGLSKCEIKWLYVSAVPYFPPCPCSHLVALISASDLFKIKSEARWLSPSEKKCPSCREVFVLLVPD